MGVEHTTWLAPATARPRRDRGAAVLALGVVAALASACGSDDEMAQSAGPASGPTSTASASGDPAGRPEGDWTIVKWTVKRSDSASNPMAEITLGTLTPSCASGPCDLTLAPAGANGTYAESEAPPPVKGTPPSKEAVPLRWDGTSYVGKTGPKVVSCNPTGLVSDSVDDGYATRRTITLTFVPPSGDTAARMHGTIVDTNKGIKTAKAKGCTDYVVTWAVGASPTGSLDAETPLKGKYDASMSSTGSTPKGLAPVGQELWLGPMTAAGGTDALTLTGLAASKAPLTRGQDGLSGQAPAAPVDCRATDGSTIAKGADGRETFSDMHAVALTEEGDPLFAGVWSLSSKPNATGLSSKCSPAQYQGRVILVPHGAGM